jgi:hypothetical protein
MTSVLLLVLPVLLKLANAGMATANIIATIKTTVANLFKMMRCTMPPS